MLADTITSKNYAATAITFTKRAIGQGSSIYRLSTSSATELTDLEIRYRSSAPKKVKFTNVFDSTGLNTLVTRHTFNVKGTLRVWGTDVGWQDATVNFTMSYDDLKTTITDAKLKDLIASVVNLPLTSALMTQFFNEEV